MKKPTARAKLLDAAFDEVYTYGYASASIDAILKRAGVPKGSLYHYFGSKKALVLTMVQERLFPKMEAFFRFEKHVGCTVYESFRNTFAAMSKNRPLIAHGCPLYRLMVELSPVDEEFDSLLNSKYHQMHANIAALLKQGISEGEFDSALDADSFAAFMLSSVWGILSLSPSLSSPKNFLAQSRFLLDELDRHRIK